MAQELSCTSAQTVSSAELLHTDPTMLFLTVVYKMLASNYIFMYKF